MKLSTSATTTSTALQQQSDSSSSSSSSSSSKRSSSSSRSVSASVPLGSQSAIAPRRPTQVSEIVLFCLLFR